MTVRGFLLVLLMATSGSLMPGQQDVPNSDTVIRAETRVVLVDAVVTDKKGQYIHGLTQKEFKVFEDGKEQQISSFSFEADPASPLFAQRHYIVIFFDNTSISLGDQMVARKAASQFLAANAGPNRAFAVVEYDGSLRITQNFTEDKDLLARAVSGTKVPNSMALFGSRIMLGGLSDMAKRLASLPGRKTLVLLSGGFAVTPEMQSWLTATIDVCNRANVAVYPIDVRGLIAGGGNASQGGRGPGAFLSRPAGLFRSLGSALANLGPVMMPDSGSPGAFGFQRGGGGSPTPGGGGGGGGRPAPSPSPSPRPTNPAPGRSTPAPTTPARTGGTAPVPLNRTLYNPNPVSPQRLLIPTLDRGIIGMQQGLYALAQGTGGFVIVNTNDLLGGMEKIGKEQNEFYLLGYSPLKEPQPGACHAIKVKVDRGGTDVRARTGYCEGRPVDVLKGSEAEHQLETRIGSGATPTVSGAAMQSSFIYIAPDTARVDVAMEIPAAALKFNKEKGKFRCEANVLGIAYRPDGGVGARFSDTVNLMFDDKKQVQAFEEKPYEYEKQFEIAPGSYTLKVAFASGAGAFGKIEAPLAISSWDGKQFTLSGIAFSKRVNKIEAGNGLDQELIEDRAPLIAGPYQVIPAATNRFRVSEGGFLYAEAYDPERKATGTTTAVEMKAIDRKTNHVRFDSGVGQVGGSNSPGASIPIALRIPADQIGPGSYTLELTAADSAGHQAKRTADFEIEP